MSQTRLVRKACQSMDILLLDHVIVCDDSFYSFADERVVTA
jgi:DNA repair protein RadC